MTGFDAQSRRLFLRRSLAASASIAVPLLHTKLQHFVLGQLVFLLMALLLWTFANSRDQA